MVYKIEMPSYVTNMKEGTLANWFVFEGDIVKKGDAIAEIAVEKLTNELLSPVDGIILKRLVEEGSTILCGEAIAHIETESVKIENDFDFNSELKSKEIIVDQTNSFNTGDISRKMTEMEKAISNTVEKSLTTIPQGTITMNMDVNTIVKYYKANKDDFQVRGIKLSYTSIITKILGKALRETPFIRTVMLENNFIEKSSVNIGIAIDIPRGLVVPNIKNCDKKNLEEISLEINNLKDSALRNKLTDYNLKGGTFTITNLGMYDVECFTPIINPGESAILGIGALKEAVLVEDGDIRIGYGMTFSLTHDHRVINGVTAAKFLQKIQKSIKKFI